MSDKNSVNKEHLYFMNSALQQARKALESDEVPIGAVVVDESGNIIAKAYNMMHGKKCQTEHAEVRAIKKACKKIGDWRLDGCRIYVTLEPCVMCYGLIKLCRISTLVYGAESPLFGYRLDKDVDHAVYKNDTMEIVSGVLKNEAIDILRVFFKKKRKKGEGRKEQHIKVCKGTGKNKKKSS